MEETQRANDIKDSLKIIHKNHCQFIKNFKFFYVSKIESLENDEYLKMKTWIAEYQRLTNIIEGHLFEFIENGHVVELTDQEKKNKELAFMFISALNLIQSTNDTCQIRPVS